MTKGLTASDRALLWQRMRLPCHTCAALLTMLAAMVVLGAWLPFRQVWMLEAAILLSMVLVVLLCSMEITREPPVHRLYAGLGFCWVGVLVGMTVIDYLTR